MVSSHLCRAKLAGLVLHDYYFSDPRLTLIPIEHLSPTGMSAQYATLALVRREWSAAQVQLFDTAFALYWRRTSALAARTRAWSPPRVRHVAVVRDPLAVRPYAQLLNTSTWTTYASDFDPSTSHAELAAYVLVHGDRMARSGEVTQAAVHNAAYWFDRSEEECAAFAAAAAQSTRPDAAAFRALAAAIPWMRELFHETLRPPQTGVARLRAIPGTGLLVPRAHEAEPPALVARWTAVAEASVASYRRRWQRGDARAVTALCDWLREQRPALLITAGERIVWDAAYPDRLGALRGLLRDTSAAAIADVQTDLEVLASRTRAFRDALTAPAALPPPDPAMAQSGYTFVHPSRGLITYNLHEPGLERLRGPALPYARDMLGARTIHEWAHLAVDAGWVPCAIPAQELDARIETVAALLDAVIEAAPTEIVARTGTDPVPPSPREPKGGRNSLGSAIANLLLARIPDFQANLLAQRFLSPAERETYVRHNIRTLRGAYTPAQLWRMLIRYLVEYQYLRFSAVDDRRTFFVSSTWFDADFFASGILDDEQFDALVAAVGRICDAYAVDERWFRNS